MFPFLARQIGFKITVLLSFEKFDVPEGGNFTL
jgi:hypothetical protein